MLEEDDSSTLEPAGEDDEDSAWGDGVPELGNLGFLVGLNDSSLDIIGWVHLDSCHRL